MADALSEAECGWELLAARLAEFDAGDESALPDFMDDRMGGIGRGESGAEMGVFCWEFFMTDSAE